MKFKKRFIFVSFIIGLSVITLAWIFAAAYLKQKKENLYFLQTVKIASLSDLKNKNSFYEQVDYLSDFINSNSQHLQDAEFFATWENSSLIAKNFIDHLEGRRKTTPHMECSTRRGLLAAILKNNMGYKTRSVDLYGPSDNHSLASHAALDIWNPDTKKWETYDPEFNIFWINTKTRERISLLDAATEIHNALPCNQKGCSWTIRSPEGAAVIGLRNLMSYIVIIDKKKQRMTYYNPAIDPHHSYAHNGKTGTYCDVIKKNCRDGFFPLQKKMIQKSAYKPL